MEEEEDEERGALFALWTNKTNEWIKRGEKRINGWKEKDTRCAYSKKKKKKKTKETKDKKPVLSVYSPVCLIVCVCVSVHAIFFLTKTTNDDFCLLGKRNKKGIAQ